MSIFVSNQNPAQGAIAMGRRNSGTSWQTGDVIQALLSDITGGKATLRMEDGTTFTADAANLQGQVGDTLTFQVNRNQEGFSLTQMLERRPSRGAERAERGTATLIDGYEENKELVNNLESMKEADELRAEYRQERAANIARIIASIRRGQNFIGGGNKSVVSAIVESGLDLAKISFADLNRVMHHVERNPGHEISSQELSQGMGRRWNRPENAQNIVTSLYNNGLAVSDKNVSAMEHAYDRLPESVSPAAIEELISKEQDLTLENVYKSCYSYGDAAKASKTESPAASLPQEVIENFFTREGIEITTANLQTARFLLERDLPLSRGNIEKVQFLQGLTIKPVDTAFAIAPELFFDKAAAHLASDTPVGALSLTEVTRFAEAQLKLAMEAANRHQNLNINLDSLRDHVRWLQISEEQAMRFLKMAGAKAEPETASQITNLFDALSTLKPLTTNVHAGILQGQIDFTVKGISESVQYAKATAGYEQNATVPNPHYGDSFSKVKGQFAPLLESMGITPTSENLKAAFILSKNKMDVSQENLGQVKTIDAKITSIANNLHPMIAAHMIKDGLSPLEMHADQMLAYIKQFNLDMGEDGSKKISRYIMEMDDAGTLDADTRKAMIATYRMLNVIQRDGAAALGLAAQMEEFKEKPMTLGDLLNLAQKHKTNANITDAFGHLESMTRATESIRGILENTATEPPTYSELITESFIDIATPTTLENMLNTSMEQAIEDLAAKEQAAKADLDATQNPQAQAGQDAQSAAGESSGQLVEQAQAQVHAFASANPDVIRNLQWRGISATTGNIRAFDRLSNSRRALADELEGVAAKEGESAGTVDSDSSGTTSMLDALPDSSLEELRDGQSPGQILAKILSALGTSGSNVSDASGLLAVTHGLNGDGENGFQIPVKLGNHVSNLSLYVLNEAALTQDGARVLMSIDTPKLGVVNTYFTIHGNHIDVSVSADTQSAITALSAGRAQLEAFLAEAGAEVGKLEFALSQEPVADTATVPPTFTPQAETAYDFRV